MEDDDEFGDLYTDVLIPFSSSSVPSLAQQPHQLSSAPSVTARPIDLNIQSDDDAALFGASFPSSAIPQKPASQTLARDSSAVIRAPSGPDAISFDQGEEVSAGVTSAFEMEDEKLSKMASKDSSREEAAAVVAAAADDDKDVKFDIEEGNTGLEDNPIIPGLSSANTGEKSAHVSAANQEDIEGAGRIEEENDMVTGGGEEGEGDDWDSDSEDDLQIVLNDNTHHGPMGMERGGMGVDDDDDELVIVADSGANPNTEEQEWGEDAAQAVDGERKEAGEAGKASVGGAAAVPKIGYSNHGYHPFHSQFKYVRPGATPIPGATTSGPGGAPGQIRPLGNMVPLAGRGRGDWRPPGMKNAQTMQKGFHAGFGMPWGNSMSGRGFGGGLEFTLPSHKTIFDVDIDGFEEKPWKYPGIEISDFFNFGLNEESWKDYCKQLEQHRLETTMQSKIRVYESGRTEEYDPDMPPELAAATGVQDFPSDNANFGKPAAGQSDSIKARLRPPLPTGRAIQVEGGYGERLPSIDTRPPRIRDSDAIIEIVLQDSFSDVSPAENDVSPAENDVQDRTNTDLPKEDSRGDRIADDSEPIETEYSDSYNYGVQKGKQIERASFAHSGHEKTLQGDGSLLFPPETPLEYRPDSRGQTPVNSRGDERSTEGRAHDRSPQLTPTPSVQDEKFLDNQEESTESMGGNRSIPASPVAVRDARESSIEQKDASPDADESSVMEKEEMINDKDGGVPHSMMKQKVTSQVEPFDDEEDSKAARSSENSKARSGSSRDYQKRRDGVEEEVVQDRHTARTGYSRKRLDENEQNYRRKDRDGRQDLERSHMAIKGREDSYPFRDFDQTLAHHSYMKTEGFDRRKDRDIPDGAWQRREDDPYSRKNRGEDSRKRDREEEVGLRHRGKVRENERSDRKQMDNGSYRMHYDKDVGSRHRERDDNLKSRYEVDDFHSKRRKDEEFLRDHSDRPEIIHGHRESTSRRKRERDDALDQQKRDDQQRIRENYDDHHSVRHKDEIWLQRERGERQRDREEWHRLKQPHEEILSKREREGRGTVRSSRTSEDRGLASHTRAKDEYKGSDKEYQAKDTIRYGEQLKRRDRIDDDNSSHHRGREDFHARTSQPSNDERKSRQERLSIRSDRTVEVSDNQRVQEKKHRDNMRKNKESEGGDLNTVSLSKRNQEDQSGHTNDMGLKGTSEPGNSKSEIPGPHNSSRKQKEDPSSDDEQQDSRRGRSKLERWTSHKERDYSMSSKSSASLKFKEINRNNNGSSKSSELPGETAKALDSSVNQLSLSEEKGGGDPEIKDVDKSLEDRHLDTVEKLKKRSERFKLPMPSEKDALVIKKLESEALTSAKSETPVDAEIKQERPARKRRWISN